MEGRRPEQSWNPVEDLPPREQAVERVLGVSEGSEGRIKDYMKEKLFESRAVLADQVPFSETERRIAERALAAMPAFVERYGARSLPITVDTLHLIQDGMNGDMGGYSPKHQLAMINRVPTEGARQLSLASTVAHEALHFNSYQTLHFRLAEDGKPNRYEQRRLGMNIGDDLDFGRGLNEAITEELTKRYYRELIENDEEFAESAEETRNIVADLHEFGIKVTDDEFVFATADSETGDVDFKLFGYAVERAKLNTLIDDLYEKRQEQYADREEVFEVFARAYFTGNLLPLGRLLEETYGKNALRRLMEGEDIVENQ